MKTNFKRLAIELAAPSGSDPAFITEQALNRFVDLVVRSPTVVIVDLGVHFTPTAHPSFQRIATLLALRLRERSGFLVVWVDSTTDRAALVTLGRVAGPVVVTALPSATLADVEDLRAVGGLHVVDTTQGDQYGLGIALAGRPDAPSPRHATTILGGCPIVEERALFIGVDEQRFACQRQMFLNEAISKDGDDTLVMQNWERLQHKLRLDRREEASKSCSACPMSYQGWIDDSHLQSLWRSLDDQGELSNAEERKHLFEEVVPTPQRLMKIDLGCGPVKRAGFVGIDRFPLPGVDIVADINMGIPLPSDSVDYLVASHSLEHFHDLPHVIHEIHRVAKDRALVTIVAPYSATSLNLANPYHVQVFNEHTARFFTNAAETALASPDYEFPSAIQWGLASSDHSDWKADLRLLKCEFFYMPSYRGLNEDAKRVLRKSLNDVVEQMLLQFLVIKSPITSDEFSSRILNTDYQEPPAVTARREEEAAVGAPNAFTELMELPDLISRVRNDVGRWSEQISELKRVTGILANQRAEGTAQLTAVGRKLGDIEDFMKNVRNSFEAERTAVGKRITAVNTQLIRRSTEQAEKTASLEKMLAELKSEWKAKDAIAEADASDSILHTGAIDVPLTSAHANQGVSGDEQPVEPEIERDRVRRQEAVLHATLRERNGAILRHARLYVRRKQDLAALVAPSFSKIKNFGVTHGWASSGFKLQESNLWQSGQEWIYDVPVKTGQLSGMELAITTQFKSGSLKPLLSCAIWSADSSTLLRGSNIMVQGDTSLEPLAVRFAPIDVKEGLIRVRLVGLPAVEWTGVRTIEWRRLNFLRQVREMRLFCRPLYE